MQRSFLTLFLALMSFGVVLPACGSPVLTTLEKLNSFSGTGAFPTVPLVMDPAGNLYGTTDFGGGGAPGSNGDGTVFEIAAGTHAYTTISVFNYSTVGRISSARLLSDAMGNLYSTAETDGPKQYGTVFQIAAGTHSLTTLAAFNGVNGFFPIGGLASDAAGNLYGTTLYGTANGYGSVFKMAAGTHALTNVATFNNTSNGKYPTGGLIADAAGNLYGETSAGGPGTFGTVFKIAAGTNTLTTLVSFNNTNGGSPSGGLISDAAGNLYGTTSQGGAANSGTIFEIVAGTSTLKTLAAFDFTTGYSPRGGVIADVLGNLYGTTFGGGTNNYGTIFKLDAKTDTIMTLASFNNSNGANPVAGLVADANGNLYGTAEYGGEVSPTNPSTTFGDGTVFELSGSGFAVPLPNGLLPGIIGLSGLGAVRRLSRKFSGSPR